MTATAPRPVSARAHRGRVRARGLPATTMLTVYIVLLVGIPSNLTISALGAYGRPQFLWGLLLFVWWAFSRLQEQRRTPASVSQLVRNTWALFLVVVLVGFAVALLRGQPADQVSPAISAVMRLGSWTGVIFVAMDGLRTLSDILTIAKRVVWACTAMAVLGIAQFVTGQSLVEVYGLLPGLSESSGGADVRGIFLRSSATATHPLEYGMALSLAVPLALSLAMLERGNALVPRRLRWWFALGILALASLLAVSRSTLIGLVVSVALMIPALPRRARGVIVISGVALTAAVVVLTPGLYGTIVGMFLGVGTDPSTQSRQAGIALAPVLLSVVPLLGSGVGTFLPRYFIFDNQWLGTLIETGVLGALAFASVFVAAIWSAVRMPGEPQHSENRLLGRGLAAATATSALLLAFFDGLSFPIGAGLMFLIFGLCSAIRTAGWPESTEMHESSRWADHHRTNQRWSASATAPRSAVRTWR